MTLVREPIFRGVREVDALLFEGPGSAEQALSHWREGATLFASDPDRVVLRLREPIWLRCEHGRATPLIDGGGNRLLAFPLDAEDVSGLPPETLTSVRAGAVVSEPLGTPIDPISLLDLSDWHAAPAPRTEPPAEPRRPIEPPTLAAPPLTFDARAHLGGGLVPTARERRRWETLRPRAPRPGASSPGRSGGAGAQGPGLLDWLYRRRHQRYLGELTRLFAAGQYEEALRRAIPLGGEGARLARSVPRPRRELRLNPRRDPGGATVDIEPGLQAELQTRYRAAFARLEADGRVHEAAFVLAELLDRPSEACSFLERHGEIRLAAELAEARTTDHAEAVRLWWRAGERDRAVALARRRGCFAPAVARLERAGLRAEATALRRSWVSQLLEAGDITAAYDASAGLEEDADRRVRERLVDIGISEGGPLRAHMLARQLRAGDEEPRPELLRAIDDPLAAAELERVLRELTRTTDKVDHPHVVRAIARRLAAERRDLDRKRLQRAVDLAEDPVLRADLPPLDQLQSNSQDLATTWVELDAADRGQLDVQDARLLPDGRVVLALPGIGVRVLRPSGTIEVDLDVPADELIASDNGRRLLAVRRLDAEAVGIAAIALPERRVRRFGEVPATTWAQTYDGASWFLAHHGQLWMLDMLPEGPVALWRQHHADGPIAAIARDSVHLAVACGPGVDPRDGSTVVTVYRYALPSLEDVVVVGRPFWPGAVLLPAGDVVDGDAGTDVYRTRIEWAEGGGATVVATKAGIEAPLVVVELSGIRRARTRIDAGSLLVLDDLGRVEVVDLTTGARRSYRTTV